VSELNVYGKFHLPAWKHLLTPEIKKIISTEKNSSGGNIIINKKLHIDEKNIINNYRRETTCEAEEKYNLRFLKQQVRL
jgi:hypothetical protein